MRPRVKELRSTIQRMGASALINKSSKKQHLVLTLRKAQVAMRIIRRRAATQNSDQKADAARVIQTWWHRIRRYIPVNPRDPITLDSWDEVTPSECFHLVTDRGAVQRYIADGLYQMIHNAASPVEPLCRHTMNIVELKRLDARVSHELLAQHGPSSRLVEEDAKLTQRQRHSVQEVVHYLQNSLTSTCGVMDNVVTLATAVGPPNNVRLMIHLASVQGEFISTFIQLCVVDLHEARHYIETTRKDYVLRLREAVPESRMWLHSMMSLLDHCRQHSSDMADMGELVVRVNV